MEAINVIFESDTVGAISFDTDTGLGAFEYAPSFIAKGIELAPLKMPLSKQIYTFPELGFETFKGLPGMLADSLPDDFGNAVLNAWVAAQGKSSADITPLQRLQYTGKRGMGALEYVPATQTKSLNAFAKVNIESLVMVAQEMLDKRKDFSVSMNRDGHEDAEAMRSLLSVGMSAGGARPKAVLAFNEDFTQVRSGQVDVPEDYTHYLMKFDGVSEHNTNKETFGDPLGYSAMEYVYYLMACACGIKMMPTKLLEEGHRRHFITQRFDRVGNKKIHVQTLNGMAHIDFKHISGTYSYEQLFETARTLRIPATDADQLLRRMIFNIIARNHDDHSKNFAFMLKEKNWRLAPAYDLAYSYRPGSKWVNSHWLALNGKRESFTRKDIHSLEKLVPSFTLKYIDSVIEQTREQVSQWKKLAIEYEVPKVLIDEVEGNLRLKL